MRRGYKQTEVGIIPDEWDVKPLGNLFGFSGGYSASRAQLTTEGHCYLHYGDIHGATKTWVDTGVDYQDIPKLDIPLKRVSSRSLLEDGDVVFVDASEDDEGTSKHVVVLNKENMPFISGLHTIVAKSKTDELVHEYRRYCFQTTVVRQQFLFYAVGTKVVGISKSNIPKVFLPVPTPPEQHAIATALNDVDALLGGLDRLIAKKRDLKQAAMQQLLTGETRLPGFRGEWEVKRLEDFGTTYGGLTGKTKADFGAGTAQYINFMNVMTNVVIDREIFERVNVSPIETQNRAKKGDLFFNGSSETPEEVAMCAVLLEEVQDVYLNSFCFGFRFREGAEADGVFFAYYLRGREGRELMKSLAQGSTRYNLSKVALLNSSLRLPTLPEQTAIAAVLSDMDAELSALVARRTKTRALKQAIMQELLTGRTRLV